MTRPPSEQSATTVEQDAPRFSHLTAHTENRPCHIIDERGRTLCGRLLSDSRPHSLTECIEADHARCSVCEEMDGGMVNGLHGEW